MVDAGTVDSSTTGIKPITGLSTVLEYGKVYADVFISDGTPSVRHLGLATLVGSGWVSTGTSNTHTAYYDASNATEHTSLSDPPPDYANSLASWGTPVAWYGYTL